MRGITGPIAVLFVLSCSGTCAAQPTDQRVRAVVERVVKAQGELPTGMTDYQDLARATHSTTSGGKSVVKRKVHFEKYSGKKAAVGNYEDAAPRDKAATDAPDSMLLVLNDDYFLSGSRNARNDAWLVKSVRPNDGNLKESSDQQYRILRAFSGKPAFTQFLPLQLRIGYTPVAELDKLPGFSAVPEGTGVDNAVARLAFRYTFTPEGDKVPVTSVCTVSFDLQAFGIPARLTEESTSGPADTRSSLLELGLKQAEADRYTYTVTRRAENKSEGQTVYKAETVSSGEIKLGPVADTEFTATGYGLPEPTRFQRSFARWYVWLFGAAGGLFVTGLVLRRVVRRKPVTGEGVTT